VRQPTLAIGQAAAAAILRLLNGQPPALPPLATELVIRESAARMR
jgi:DNA-binding LacI/PurR family transcriptional regulator